MNHRNGHSLIECIAAFTLISAAFGSVTLALYGVSRADRRLRDELRAELDRDRLATQLRSDAHEATSVATVGGQAAQTSPATVVLAMPRGRTASYAIQSRRILRTLSRDAKVVQHETYYLPAALQATWQIDRKLPRPILSLAFEPDPTGIPGPTAPQPWRIDAAVGLLGPQPASSKP